MRPVTQRAHRGADFKGGKRLANGYLLNTRNMRYLPGDQKRLWALLGRSVFDSSFPVRSLTPEKLFPIFIEGGTHKLCLFHSDIFEADLGATGTFALDSFTPDGGPGVTGRPFQYLDNLYLFYLRQEVGSVWADRSRYLVREPSGWTHAGQSTPSPTLSVTLSQQNPGSGVFTSSTDLKYLFTIYDEDINAESLASDIETIAGPIDGDSVRITFDADFPGAGGVSAFNLRRGTHLRIYGTIPDEEPGVYWRVDNENGGKGIALPISATDTYDDSTAGTTRLVQGTRPADGIEGEVAWAEYGGEPPEAQGGIEYRNHVVSWGSYGREEELIYSALGMPESFPVDTDGEYAYYLNFTSKRADVVQFCLKAGPYLLVFMREGVFRVTHLPTFQNPGFDRKIQDQLTDRHGAAGPNAGDSFGIGEDRSQMGIYVSVEHGPMVTDGVFMKPVLRRVDWHNLINPAYASGIWVQDYPAMEEVWIFYTPKGGTTNTEAVIVDYSRMSDPSDALAGGLRITGPVDVQATWACYGTGNDGKGRMYLLDGENKEAYVQDQGSVDAQQNYSGTDIPVRAEFPRISPGGRSKMTTIRRSMVSGGAGTQKTFTLKHYTLDGVEEYTTTETVPLGAGETETGVLINGTAQAHRSSLEFDGPTGDTYDEAEATCAPHVESIEHEVEAAGRQHRTH